MFLKEILILFHYGRAAKCSIIPKSTSLWIKKKKHYKPTLEYTHLNIRHQLIYNKTNSKQKLSKLRNQKKKNLEK